MKKLLLTTFLLIILIILAFIIFLILDNKENKEAISTNDNIEYREVISTNLYKTNKIQIVRVHFDFNKTNLVKEFIEDSIIPSLETNKNILKIYIEGHTDSKGRAEYNYKLGLKRALTVSNIIFTNRNLQNIALKSFGYSNSIADNRAEEGRAINRRADIFIDLVEETFELQTNLIKVDSKNKFNIDLKILLIIILIILLLLILLLVVNKIAALPFIFERIIIKILTGWSNEIVNAIGSWKEYKIYKKAGLVQAEINGKKCLIKPDIDMEQKSINPFTGEEMTNAERIIKKRLAPLDKNGKPIHLHHIGQRPDSPLAELTFEEHRMGGNDTILHDKNRPTEVHFMEMEINGIGKKKIIGKIE